MHMQPSCTTGTPTIYVMPFKGHKHYYAHTNAIQRSQAYAHTTVYAYMYVYTLALCTSEHHGVPTDASHTDKTLNVEEGKSEGVS